MSVALLDVNVLVALVWSTHESHNKVQNWFQQHAKGGWATGPVTQAGLARIVSNPAFSLNAVSANDAISLLKANVAHPSHRFCQFSLLMDSQPQQVSIRNLLVNCNPGGEGLGCLNKTNLVELKGETDVCVLFCPTTKAGVLSKRKMKSDQS